MSSTIDNRIVHMEFDNGKFESGVRTTMSTLEKLKNALNFGNRKNTGLESISEAAKKVDLSTIQDGLGTVEKRFTTLGIIGTTALANITNSAVNVGKNLVKNLFGSITQGGIRRALNIEQAKFTIEGLGKSFRELKGDINYAVEGTAYGFDEAAKAASSMAASGIKGGNQMKEALRSISGTAAMTGSSYSDIADVFTTVAGQGRLLSQQLNQLSSRGLNAAATLTDYLNKHTDLRKSIIETGLKSEGAGKKVAEFADATKLTEKNVRTLVTASAIDFKTFSKAMDSAFGDHAKAADKTFTGAMANIKASLSRIGASFVLPAIETNQNDAMLLETYKKLDERLLGVAKSAKTAADETVGMKSKFQTAVYKMPEYSEKSNKEIKKLLETNDKAFRKEINKLPEFKKKSNKEILSLFKDETEIEKAEFRERAKLLPEYANMSDKELNKLYNKYKGFQYNLVTVAQAVKRVFGAVEQNLSKSDFLKGFLAALESGSKALSLFLNAVAATFSTVTKNGKTISQAIEVFGKSGHILKASKLWERFRQVVGLTKTDLNNLGDTAKGIFSIFDLFGTIISEVFKALAPTGKVLSGIGSILLTITGTIGRFITAVVSLIKHSRIIQIVFGTIGAVFNVVATIFQSVARAIALVITTLSDNIVFKTLVNTINNLFDAFYDLLSIIGKIGKGVVGYLLKPFTSLSKHFNLNNAVLNIFESVLTKINSVLTSFGNSIKQASVYLSRFITPEAIQKFGNVALGVFDSLGKFVLNLWDSLKKFDLESFFTILAAGVVAAFNTIKDVLEGFNIWDIFSTEEAHGASGIEKETEKHKTTIEKFIDYLKNAKDKIKIALDSAFKVFGELFSNIKLPKPNILGRAIGNLIIKAFELVKAIIPNVVGVIAAIILTIGDYALAAISSAGAKISDALSGEAKRTASSAGSVFDNIGTVLRGAIAKIAKILDSATLRDAIDLLEAGVVMRLISLIGKLSKAVGGVSNVESGITGFFVGLRKSINDLVKSYKQIEKMKAMGQVIKDFAVSLAILTASLLVLSFIPDKNLIKGGIALGVLAVGVTAFIFALMKMEQMMGRADQLELIGDRFSSVSTTLVALGGAIIVLVGSVMLLSKMSWDSFLSGLGKLIVLLGSLTGFMLILGKLKLPVVQIFAFSKSLMKIALALIVLSGALLLLSAIDLGTAIADAVKILFVLGSIAAIFIGLSHFKADPKIITAFGNSLIKLSASLLIISVSLMLLSKVNSGKLAGSLVALVGTLGAVSLAVIALANFGGGATNVANIAKSMIVLSAAIAILARSLYVLSGGEHIIASMFAIAGALAALTVSVIAIDQLHAADTLMPLSIAILALGASFALLGQIPMEGMIAGLIGIAGALAALTVATVVISSTGPVGVVALTALGAAILAFGAGLALASAGALGFATAITMLSNISSEGLNNLKAVIDTMISAIPNFITAVADGVMQVLAKIGAMAPLLITTATVLVSSFAMGLANSAGAVANAGLSLLVSLLTAINNNIFKIVTLAGSIIVNFIYGLAVMVPTLIQAAIDLMVQFINGLAMGIEQNTEVILAAVSNLLASVITFILSALQAVFGKIPVIGDKIVGGINKAKEGVNKVLRDGKTAAEAAKQGKNVADAYTNKLKTIAANAKKSGGNARKNFIDEVKKMPEYADVSRKELGKVFDKLDKDTSSKSKKTGKNIKKGVGDATIDLPNISKKDLEKYGLQFDALDKVPSKVKSKVGKVSKAAKDTEGFGASGKSNAKSLTDKFLDSITKTDGAKGSKKLKSGAESVSMSGAGSFLGDGLASGFNGRNWYELGASAARKVNKGFQDTEEEHSPSKLWEKFGVWLGQGLVNGLDSMGSALKHSGIDAATNLNKPLRKAVLSINDEFSNIGGISDPVIKPVLDLTDVKRGANDISGMLNNRYALGLASGNAQLKSVRGLQIASMQSQKSEAASKPITITNNIKVDGSTDPAKWADEFMQELEVQARKY